MLDEGEPGDLRDAEPAIPEALDDRAADCWRPLLAIADAAGGAWPERARLAALALSASRDTSDDGSLGVALLRDVREAFGGADKLASKVLVERLVQMEERPWGDMPEPFRGGPLTPARLSKLLRAFGILSRSVRLTDGTTPKGYHRHDFHDVWDTYFPDASPPGDATPPHASSGAASEAGNGRHNAGDVAGSPRGGSEADATTWRCGGAAPGAADADDFEERAAIMEFDAGMQRAMAEQRASVGRGSTVGTGQCAHATTK